jgi:hypothetical protein
MSGADAILTAVQRAERWLDKKGLAEHYSCSVRSVETAMAEGMPHAIIFGRPKFQPSATDPWLRGRGARRHRRGVGHGP